MGFFSLLKSIFEEDSVPDTDEDYTWKSKFSNNKHSYTTPNVPKKQRNDPEFNLRNPVLNSPFDVTDDLIQRIIDNNLDSLTINYEFTRERDENSEGYQDYFNFRYYSNPFFRANRHKPLKRIEFEVRLTRNVSSLHAAFSGMKDLEYVNLNDTSMITDMSFCFSSAKAFNQQIGHWNTSNVTNMAGMFAGAEAFNQPIGDWDTSKVTKMNSMFSEAYAFNQPIGNWSTSNVTEIWGMFYHARSFNQPIDRWNLSKVSSLYAMFCGAYAFNQPIGDWDVSNVTTMEHMFGYAKSFNQPICNWNTSKVENISSMFENAESFNQPIGNWNVSNVKYAAGIFMGAKSFNQDLSAWMNNDEIKFILSL